MPPTDEKKARWSYRVVPDGRLFAVICIHDDSPDWWHVVARFDQKDRADRYVEVENDMIADSGLEADEGWEGDETPAPVATLPVPGTSITLERITERVTARSSGNHVDDAISADITHRLAEGESVRDVMAATGVAKNTVQVRRDALVEIGAVPARRSGQGRAPVSADEIERRVQAAERAIRDLDAEGEKISYPTVAERCGMPHGSVAPAIETLKNRGIIRVFGHGEIDATELREKGGIRLMKPEAAEAEAEDPHDNDEMQEPGAPEPEEENAVDTLPNLTAAECAQFRQLWKDGAKIGVIAERLHIQASQVAAIKTRLNLPDRGAPA